MYMYQSCYEMTKAAWILHEGHLYMYEKNKLQRTIYMSLAYTILTQSARISGSLLIAD